MSHFASKQALFEAVLDLQEARVTADVLAAAQSPDPWQAAAEPGSDRRHLPAEVRRSR